MSKDGGGWTAFFGSLLFLLGSIGLVLEVLNANREGCIGWEVESAWDEELEETKYRVSPESYIKQQQQPMSGIRFRRNMQSSYTIRASMS